MLVEQAPPLWKKVAVRFYDAVREDFGYPASLLKLVDGPLSLSSPIVETVKGIGSTEVVRWHEFGSLFYEKGMFREKLNGWSHCKTYGRYGSTSLHCEDLLNLGNEIVINDWQCDIQHVDGFAASKSKLETFDSMDEMVETNSKEMISELTPAALSKNLSWDQIRIISQTNHDHFASWGWDGRVFLMNSGGSHHFAAAKYIAARIGQPVRLSGTYKIYGVCQKAVSQLRRDFAIFTMSSEPDAWLGFNDAMANFKATYYWKTLPRPHNNKRYAVFLPLKEKRSALVAKVLRDRGYQDLGALLAGIAARSSEFSETYSSRKSNP